MWLQKVWIYKQNFWLSLKYVTKKENRVELSTCLFVRETWTNLVLLWPFYTNRSD